MATTRSLAYAAWQIMVDFGQEAYEKKYYSVATFFYRIALQFSSRTRIETAALGRLFLLMGELQMEQGDYLKASQSYKTAVFIFQRGELSSLVKLDLANGLRKISELLKANGQFLGASEINDEAEKLIGAARQSLERCFSKPSALHTNLARPAKNGLFPRFAANFFAASPFSGRFF